MMLFLRLTGMLWHWSLFQPTLFGVESAGVPGRDFASFATDSRNDKVTDMERGKKQQTVNVDRGLFLVRYAAAEDEVQPPKVMVSADPPSNKDVSFLLHPDHNEPVLWQPETCLVVRALAPAKLAIQVVPLRAGGSVAATVKIETLSQGMADPVPVQPKIAKRFAARSQRFSRASAMSPELATWWWPPTNGSRALRRRYE